MHTCTVETPPDSVPSTAQRAARPSRLAWLDNLRIALTVLVVVHHAAQAYGPADWWYVEKQPRSSALATLSAVDGAFFMSLFFFVSAVFVPGSYERRGARRFLTGRLLRLGVPLLVGALTIVPGLMYAYYVHYRGYSPISYGRYFTDVYLGLGDKPADWTGPSWPDLQFGHLWFIQNLLAYSVLYVICRQAARLLKHRGDREHTRHVPGHRTLLLLTVALAAATFLIRLKYPLDTWVPVLDFLQVEPARLPQYATFFALGVLAHRHGRLHRFDARTGWLWLTAGLLGVALLFAVGADAPAFGPGGLNGASALWSTYESFLCVALSVGLLTLFRETLTGTNRLTRELSASSYAVYILHLPIVVTVQYFLVDRGLTATAAWLITSAVGAMAAIMAAAGIRRLPGAAKIL
ncbi:acyltransferase family protein [Streptomyces sp. CCM_MD2014]|uniref:acyltransferase family protein n=1 Tax=Streptomyces sp. CCM_MD2014 TaxID=1561022 RepID=UPI00099C7F72|nr:acyltransferase [Streptomyces sp. CCM_MD2014]